MVGRLGVTLVMVEDDFTLKGDHFNRGECHRRGRRDVLTFACKARYPAGGRMVEAVNHRLQSRITSGHR